jgi:hypothetical protein
MTQIPRGPSGVSEHILNEHAHVLVCIAEEGGEVGKEACKALRFSIEDTNYLFPGSPNQRAKLVDELNDLMGAIRLAVQIGIIPADWQDSERQEAKVKKIRAHFGYARDTGALARKEKK